MKLIVTGSRSITDYSVVRNAIVESGLWDAHKNTIEVLCGMDKGVDMLGKQFAEQNKLKLHKHPIEWSKWRVPGANVALRHGQKCNTLAGIWRNHAMGEAADAAIIVWDGVGTMSFDMLNYMLSLDKPTYLYPTRSICTDLFDSLTLKGCEIICPNSLTSM